MHGRRFPSLLLFRDRGSRESIKKGDVVGWSLRQSGRIGSMYFSFISGAVLIKLS
jgi:hypothetical protein